MKMVIYTKNEDLAAKPGWIVRTLYLLGCLHVLACAILGAIFLRPIIGVWLSQFGMDYNAASSGALVIAVFAGIVVGLMSGLVYFALSQALDDLHALRTIVSSYVAVDVERDG